VLGFIVPLVAFYILVSVFSDGAESQARWKILALSVLATAVLVGVSTASPTLMGLVAACLLAALVSFVGLILWIKVTRLQALKISGSYVGFVVAYSLAVTLLLGSPGPH
jgi:hypothetical protein